MKQSYLIPDTIEFIHFVIVLGLLISTPFPCQHFLPPSLLWFGWMQFQSMKTVPGLLIWEYVITPSRQIQRQLLKHSSQVYNHMGCCSLALQQLLHIHAEKIPDLNLEIILSVWLFSQHKLWHHWEIKENKINNVQMTYFSDKFGEKLVTNLVLHGVLQNEQRKVCFPTCLLYNKTMVF